MRKHIWKITTVILIIIILCSGVATAVDGLWIPLYGGEVPADADIIIYNSTDALFKSLPLSGDATIDNTGDLVIGTDSIDDTMIDWGSGSQVDTDDIPEGSTNKFEGTTAGDYLTLTGEDIDHDPVLRMIPEIFACSMTGDTSTSWGDCEAIDFGGIELHVIELTAGNSTAFFHIKTPADFGYGGNTTLTVSYGIRTDGTSSGSSLIMATLVGTSIADALTENWNNSPALAWTANDEIYWTADLIIDESLGSGSQDLVIGVKLVSEDYNGSIYLDKFTSEAWGV